MIPNNYFQLFVLSLLLTGLFFLVSPENALAQGCCRDAGGSMSCVPGLSFPNNESQETCEMSASGREWLPNDLCQTGGGPPQCVPAVGCCAMPNQSFPSAFICTDDIEPGQCDAPDDQFFLDQDCAEISICTPPTGCCETDTVDMCLGGLTEQQCFENNGGSSWTEGVLCTTGVGCGDDPVGCCSNGLGGCDIRSQSTCPTDVQPGLTCNNQATCGPLGCCQGDGICSITLAADCDTGTWIESDMCTLSGLCSSFVSGCCQLTSDPNTCEIQMGNQIDCPENMFFPTLSCLDSGVCGEIPLCCVLNSDSDDACVLDIPVDICEENGGIVFAGDNCPANPCIGCCQDGTGDCQVDENGSAEACGTTGGTYFPGQPFCIADDPSPACGDIPTGCCVCGEADCSVVTEVECAEMPGDCSYQGDNVPCEGIDICDDSPGCCFLNPDGPDGIALLSRAVDPDKCVDTTRDVCSEIGGDFQGPGTDCAIDFPEQCSEDPIIRNVPTLGQWGLIVIAGLLGIYSLIIITRRSKFNVG